MVSYPTDQRTLPVVEKSIDIICNGSRVCYYISNFINIPIIYDLSI